MVKNKKIKIRNKKKNRFIEKLKKFDKKLYAFELKSDLFLLGLLSAIGIFVVALAGTLASIYFFRQLKEYSKLVTFLLNIFFSLVSFKGGFKIINRYFKKGYWSGVIIFSLSILIGIIVDGLRWNL